MQKFDLKDHEASLLPEGKKWKLVWHDEFDGDALDESKWSYRLNFWGKHADQYTDKGVSLDGNSNVVFRPVIEDGKVKSAQLQTGALSFDNLDFEGAIKSRMEGSTGDNPWGEIELWPFKPFDKPKFMHRYGYYEARVKFQSQKFWWSAFWLQSPMTGMSHDPARCGVESDIIENFKDGTLTSGNIHGGYGKNFQETARIHYPFEEDGEYHRFGMEWSKDGYVFYLDGKEMARSNEPVSHTEQFVLISTEIKGYRTNHPKTQWTEEEMNDRFIVDYVRVFDEVEE